MIPYAMKWSTFQKTSKIVKIFENPIWFQFSMMGSFQVSVGSSQSIWMQLNLLAEKCEISKLKHKIFSSSEGNSCKIVGSN